MHLLSIASYFALLAHVLACPLSTQSILPRSKPAIKREESRIEIVNGKAVEVVRAETFTTAGLKTYEDINW